MNRNERVAIPMLSIFREHSKALILGTLIAVATFVLFYLLTVFCLSWGTTHLGYSRNEFLVIQLIGVLFFGATVPFSASLADRYGRRITLILISGAILVSDSFSARSSAPESGVSSQQ